MITKLTKEQESQIPFYINKWVKKASEPMNHKKAIKYTRMLYKSMGEDEPLVVFGFSPFNTACLCAVLKIITKKDKPQWLHSQLDRQLDSQLSKQLCSQLDNQLHSQLSKQLRSQLDNQLCSQLNKINTYWYLGVWWLAWCGWYEFAKKVGVSFSEDSYNLFVGFNSEVNFIIPYKGIAFISEKPVEINWQDKRLHKDGGMSVKYSDGWGIYSLNGVSVPKELAVTPAGQLKTDFFKKETNAEVRAQFVRKYGIERMRSLGKVVDKQDRHDYELIDMGDIFESVEYAPYLKMVNPSTGTVHMEGVHPDCRTVEQALNWRAGVSKWEPVFEA